MHQDQAISISDLGKQYALGHVVSFDRTFREVLTDLPKRFKKSHFATGADEKDYLFWALKNINLEVKQGEVLGIIGPNGAGKSTLLKLISRITTPTTGEISIRGRVGSLLEVGTGFHSELTGRENIYFNGAILGMKRQEIDAKFDDIVEFAGVEDFLDTPVKRYSSGMRIRLGFAVAANLEPEILIIDEVLAVGDAQFQKRCLGKMEGVAKSGRTVLFVSHNMGAISTLCSRGVYLDKGQILLQGTTDEVIAQYLDMGTDEATVDLRERQDRRGSGLVRVTGITFLDMETQAPVGTIIAGQDICIKVSYERQDGKDKLVRDANFGLAVFTKLGQFVTVLNSIMASNQFEELPPHGAVYCHVPRFPLMWGEFSIRVTLQTQNQLSDQVDKAVSFMVEKGDYFETGNPNTTKLQGVFVENSWRKEPTESKHNHA